MQIALYREVLQKKLELKLGDIIVKFDGKSISTMKELEEIKNSKKVGDKIEVTFYRNNNEKTVSLTLGED